MGIAIKRGLFSMHGCKSAREDWDWDLWAHWPFEKAPSNSLDDPNFIENVRALLSARACITTGFHTHEQNLANSFRLQGISLSLLERAIHLGCARRYLHLLTTGSRAGISSFFYFQNLVAEVKRTRVREDYWAYISYKLHIFEEMWKSNKTQLWFRLLY